MFEEAKITFKRTTEERKNQLQPRRFPRQLGSEFPTDEAQLPFSSIWTVIDVDDGIRPTTTTRERDSVIPAC